jgi:GT2 family glycosyltransferase
MSKLVIIIVNWNTGELLLNCVKSLQQLSDGEKEIIDEVIIVDNASTDKSIIKAQHSVGKSMNKPRVRFIMQENNLGFSKANNIAIDRVIKKNGDFHVLLLNPDTEVREGALSSMLKVLEEGKSTGVVAPHLINSDGSTQSSVRSFPGFGEFVFLLLKLNRILPKSRRWQRYMRVDFDYTKQENVDQVMGAAFLIRGDLLTTVGLLDENFWVWFEEVDYCKRAKQADWEIVYTPEAEVMHYGGVSFNQLVLWKKTWPWFMSMMHYASKYFNSFEQVILWLLLPLALILSLPSSIMHLAVRRENKKIL